MCFSSVSGTWLAYTTQTYQISPSGNKSNNTFEQIMYYFAQLAYFI